MATRSAPITGVVFILLALAALVHAGQRGAAPPIATGSGFIMGRVVDADSGRGLGGVMVMLSPPTAAPVPVGELTVANSAAPASGGRRVLTAADGRFLFRDLGKGQFTITASAPSHVFGLYGQLRPLGPGQTIDLNDNARLGNVTIKLWRNGSITGTVRDEHSEPAAGVSVECFRRVFTGGQKRLAQAVTVLTDDRGIYRAALLAPGDYVCGSVLNPITLPIAVATTPTTTPAGLPTDESRRMSNSAAVSAVIGVRIGDLLYSAGSGTLGGPLAPPPDANGRVMVYAPQYHGGSMTTAQATIISLKAGEEKIGADIQLRLVPSVRISGRLVGPDGPVPFLGLTLLPASGDDIVSEGQASYSRTTSDPSGNFTLIGIPAGEYVLKGRLYPRPSAGAGPVTALAAVLDENTAFVSTPIVAGSTDQTNLTIPVRYGLRVRGRVEFAGARQLTPAEIQRVGVRMQMAEGRTSSPVALDGRVQADATFKTAGYPSGRYIANVLPNTVPPGWSVKSILLNGRDVSVEPMELSDADVGGVVVTLTDKTTTLTGTVSGVKGPDEAAEVVVFPADSMAWKEIGVVARRSRVDRASKTGTFVFTGLPPGEYFVAAPAGSLAGDRQDPVFLALLMRDAARVTLTDGGTASVTVAVKR